MAESIKFVALAYESTDVYWYWIDESIENAELKLILNRPINADIKQLSTHPLMKS